MAEASPILFPSCRGRQYLKSPAPGKTSGD
jgi:hypothetical protein